MTPPALLSHCDKDRPLQVRGGRTSAHTYTSPSGKKPTSLKSFFRSKMAERPLTVSTGNKNCNTTTSIIHEATAAKKLKKAWRVSITVLLTLQVHKCSLSVTKNPDSSAKHQKKIQIKSSVAPGHDSSRVHSSTVSLAVSYYRLQTLDPLQLLPTCTVTGREGLRREEEGRAHWRDIVTNMM